MSAAWTRYHNKWDRGSSDFFRCLAYYNLHPLTCFLSFFSHPVHVFDPSNTRLNDIVGLIMIAILLKEIQIDETKLQLSNLMFWICTISNLPVTRLRYSQLITFSTYCTYFNQLFIIYSNFPIHLQYCVRITHKQMLKSAAVP